MRGERAPSEARAYPVVPRIGLNPPTPVSGEPEIVDLSDEDLLDIPGIGKDLAAKTRELADRGSLAYHEELLQELPRTLLDLLELPGLGPRTVARLYHELGVTSIEELETAARAGRIRGLRGLGTKREEMVLRTITRRRSSGSSTA